MTQHLQERGFVDELVDLLISEPFRNEGNDIGEFLRDEETPFDLNAFINTLGRETLSSEKRVEGDFTERLPRADSEFSMAQFFANEETGNIGDSIVLSSILKQLNLPSVSMNVSGGEHAFSNIDIVDFVDPLIHISTKDIAVGNLRRAHNKSGTLGRDI